MRRNAVITGDAGQFFDHTKRRIQILRTVRITDIRHGTGDPDAARLDPCAQALSEIAFLQRDQIRGVKDLHAVEQHTRLQKAREHTAAEQVMPGIHNETAIAEARHRRLRIEHHIRLAGHAHGKAAVVRLRAGQEAGNILALVEIEYRASL